MNPSDTSHKTIEALFYQQIKKLSLKASRPEAFDLQFSDRYQQFSI